MRAQLTLDDGQTPGAMRFGAIIINACIARGCRIVPNPLNQLPPEYDQHILRLEDEDMPVLKNKGGRPKKVKA